MTINVLEIEEYHNMLSIVYFIIVYVFCTCILVYGYRFIRKKEGNEDHNRRVGNESILLAYVSLIIFFIIVPSWYFDIDDEYHAKVHPLHENTLHLGNNNYKIYATYELNGTQRNGWITGTWDELVDAEFGNYSLHVIPNNVIISNVVHLDIEQGMNQSNELEILSVIR